MLQRIKKFIFQRHLKSVVSHMRYGASHFLNNFRLMLLEPIPNKKYVTVGNDTMLDCHIHFESGDGEVIIGDRVYIGASTIICKTRIEFGNDIFVAWGAYFYDHDSHSLDHMERRKDLKIQLQNFRAGKDFRSGKDWSTVNTKPIKVCSDAWIGMNCIILKGVTIGEGAVVAAGSVVTKDVDPWTVVAGNPAKPVYSLNPKTEK